MLVCATGGEAGDVLNPAMEAAVARGDLASIRREELARAAETIGYAEVIHLGYRDSGMPGSEHNEHPDAFTRAPTEAVLEQMVRIVRRERPHVVMGYDDHQRYPHPDHLKVHDVTVALGVAAAARDRFPDAGDPWTIPRVYAPVFTRTRALAFHEAAIARGLESPYADWLAAIEAMDPDPDVWRVDVRGFVEQGRRALLAHATQIDPDGHWFRLPTEVVEAVYPYEDFELLWAAVETPRRGGDLLDGLIG